MELKNTSAIVTGGASGLGAATAKALVKEGAMVFAIDLPSSINNASKQEGVTYIAADVTDEAEIQLAVKTASAKLALKTVVNCAGIGPSSRILSKKGVHDFGLFSKVVQINLLGTFNVMAQSANAIAQNEPDEFGQRGIIINTASVAAYEGQIGQAAYAASKGGVVGLTLPAARDLSQYGIRVNTIAPGIVETPMLSTVAEEFRESLCEGIPFPKRLARPAEYAQLVTFLVAHDYMNGETIRMDGALRMAPR